MFVKYSIVILFLSAGNAFAQEVNDVLYNRDEREVIIKKSGKKKIRHVKTVVEDRAAELIYSSSHLLFISEQGTDTVALSKINKTSKDFLGRGRFFDIEYNNKSSVITLLFCKRKNAKKFKQFLKENGGHYSRDIGKKILLGSLLVLLSPLGTIDPFGSSLPPLWRHWQKTCDASEK